MLEAGERARDFSLTSHEGKAIRLKDFYGKKLVLYFFPKADTPG
jgi:thioredoxin-dependent peroxiredoxin